MCVRTKLKTRLRVCVCVLKVLKTVCDPYVHKHPWEKVKHKESEKETERLPVLIYVYIQCLLVRMGPCPLLRFKHTLKMSVFVYYGIAAAILVRACTCVYVCVVKANRGQWE